MPCAVDGLWPTAQSTWRSRAHVHGFLLWEASGSEKPSLAFPGTPLHGLFPNPFCIGRPCLIRTSCTDGKKGPLPSQSPAPASALSCFEPYPIEFCPHLQHLLVLSSQPLPHAIPSLLISLAWHHPSKSDPDVTPSLQAP